MLAELRQKAQARYQEKSLSSSACQKLTNWTFSRKTVPSAESLWHPMGCRGLFQRERLLNQKFSLTFQSQIAYLN